MSAFQQGLSELAAGNRLRQAALLLHSVAPSDQAWLLERVSQPQRQRLRAMLDELRALGVPAAAVHSDGDSRARAPGKSAAAVAGPSPTDRVAAASAATVAALLREEPPVLVAMLLQAHDWPWRRQVASHFPAAAQQRSSAPGASTPAKLAEVLIARVAERLEQEQGRPALQPCAASGWQRTSRALRALLGRR